MLAKLDLKELLKFVELTNLFSIVYRKTITNKDLTLENNSQHSFHMAIVAWYICQKNSLELNTEKILKYALIHDLLEVYSGSFPAYERTKVNQKSKEEKETLALEKIKEEFKDFPELEKSISDFNKRRDKESKFIYALDKLIPLLNIEVNNNNYYFKTKTTYEDMLKVKATKISNDPIINEYFILLQEYLTCDVKFFWPDCEDIDYSNKFYKKL